MPRREQVLRDPLMLCAAPKGIPIAERNPSTPRQRDMLWQLWGERLGRVKDPEFFILFERAVRATWPSMDWQRLLAPMSNVCGAARARAALLKAKESTQNPQQRAALEGLLKAS